MTKKVYQIKITLNGSAPEIWRRLLIPSDLLLSNFHYVIQTAMGWTNSHLHQFVKDRTFYTERMVDDDLWEEMDNIDYKGMIVSDLLKRTRSRVTYEYDFGDSWEHEIVVEKVLSPDDSLDCPICLAGEMNCPPEDCGGVWGYSDLLKILKQPEHEEYKEYLEWLGGEFDPSHFDKNEVNSVLKSFDSDSV